jgi:predicted alpha/beta hydrolase family esterase
VPQLLFVHGGGDEACDYDREIVDRLQQALGAKPPVALPHIPALEALDWAQVEAQLGKVLDALPAGAIVIAHSVGGAAVLKLLSQGYDSHLGQLFLLAVPYTGADGEWGKDAFAFPADFAKRLPRSLPVTLWHSRDDAVIPVESAERYRQKLTRARIILLDGYGHQFEGPLGFLADAIQGALQ